MKLIPVEANSLRLDGGSMFGHTPKALWGKWMLADALNRVKLSCRCLLVQTDDGRNLLVDVGTGDFFEPKLKERYGVEGTDQLRTNLHALGIREHEIEGIILTHLHFDHAGGLLSSEKPYHLLFPNAKIYIGKSHWLRALKPHKRERASFLPHLHQLLQESHRLVLIEGEEHPDFNFGLHFLYSNGHTEGLLIPCFSHEKEPFIFPSDLIPGAHWVHLPIVMGYDRFAELIVDEKEKLLNMIAGKNGSILFTHDPSTAIGKITKHGDQFTCNVPENL